MIETVRQEMSKKIYLIINIVIALLVIIGITCYLRYDIFQHDDFLQSFFYTKSLKELVLTADHGRYLSWFAMKSVVHGSSILFNVHPQDNVFGNIFRGFDFALLGYLLSCVFYIDKDKKSVNPLIYITGLGALFYYISLDFPVLVHYNQHFGYVFNLLFFFPVILLFGKSYINQTKIPVWQGALGAFLVAISAHFNVITVVGMLFFIAFCELLRRNFRVPKDLLTPLKCFIFGLVCYFVNPNFHYIWRTARMPEEPFFSYAVQNILPFLKDFYTFVIDRNVILFCLIIVAIFLVYKFSKDINKSKRVISLALSVVFGVCLFNFSLFACGRTYYGSARFWLCHHDLQFITAMFLIVALAILLSQIKIKWYIPVALILALCLGFNSLGLWKINYLNSIITRRTFYKIEKTNIFYYLNNSNISYLPQNNILEEWLINEKFNVIYKKNFKLLYKINLPKLEFLNKADYNARIKQDGLEFSPEELTTLKFSDLYDYLSSGM